MSRWPRKGNAHYRAKHDPTAPAPGGAAGGRRRVFLMSQTKAALQWPLPPRSHGHRREPAEDTPRRGLLTTLADKAGNIDTAPVLIRRVVLFLLRTRFGAAGFVKLQ